MFLSSALDLWWHGSDPRYVDEMRGVAKWVTDFIPVPGEFYRD
jgi:hypothetical protein